MALPVEIAQFFGLLWSLFVLLPMFVRNVIYLAVMIPIIISLCKLALGW